jgi:hypothetical protein
MALGFADDVPDNPMESALLVPSTELSQDQRAFLSAFISTGKIRQAAKLSKIHAFYHYGWRRDDPSYDNAYQQCLNIVADDLAETARDRAKGYDFEMLGKDGEIVKLRRHSDVLLMFALKGLPGGSSYKESSKGDTTININGKEAKVAFNFDEFRNLLK